MGRLQSDEDVCDEQFTCEVYTDNDRDAREMNEVPVSLRSKWEQSIGQRLPTFIG